MHEFFIQGWTGDLNINSHVKLVMPLFITGNQRVRTVLSCVRNSVSFLYAWFNV